MGSAIKFILYKSADYEKTIALRYAVLRKPLGLNYTRAQLEAESNDYHIAAFDGEEVTGCIILSPVTNSMIKMRQFAVKEELQKKGIGTHIVHFCEEWAKANGYNEITLHARLTAVPFYERLNYMVQGDKFVEVGLPHFKMVKGL